MTIESVASLPGHGQEAPISNFHFRHRNVGTPAMPRLCVASDPHRQLPKIALADDPPRGRILVVTDQAQVALEVQRILRDGGYRAVGPAGSAEEAGRLAKRRPVDGAIVDLQLVDGRAQVVADRFNDMGVPYVWLTDALLGTIPTPHAFAPLVEKPVKGEELIRALDKALSRESNRANSIYPVPPPQDVWPRIFPQL
jgi:CheY-like chemotaxis protein